MVAIAHRSRAASSIKAPCRLRLFVVPHDSLMIFRFVDAVELLPHADPVAGQAVVLACSGEVDS